MIAAPAEKLFAIVSDPSQHPAIDGSGMVREAPGPGKQLAPGDEFGMRMRLGAPYSMVNEVVEFEAGRRIAWRPHPPRLRWLTRRTGGHVWRYEFEPVEGGTRVRETYDWSAAPLAFHAYIVTTGWPNRARRAMERTLERLAAHVTSGE